MYTMLNGAYNLVLVACVCAVSAYYGRRRRRSGSPVTPRESIRIGLIAGAIFFPLLCLPAILVTLRMTTPVEGVEMILSVVAVGLAPLGIFLLTTWLMRLAVDVQRPKPGAKAPESRHPLD
jgi:hypothetical protein